MYISRSLIAILVGCASVSAQPIQTTTKTVIRMNHSSNILDLSDLRTKDLAFAIRDPQTSALSYTTYPFFIKKKGYFYQGNARLQGYAVPQKLISNSCELTDIHLPPEILEGKPSSTITLEANLYSNSKPTNDLPFDADNSSTYNYLTSAWIYDSSGSGHVLNVYFAKISQENNWNIYLTSDRAVITQGTVEFNPDGTFLSSTGLDKIPMSMGANTQYIQLNMPLMTQFATPFSVYSMYSDGYPAGDAAEERVSENGYVSVYYTNGVEIIVSKVAVA